MHLWEVNWERKVSFYPFWLLWDNIKNHSHIFNYIWVFHVLRILDYANWACSKGGSLTNCFCWRICDITTQVAVAWPSYYPVTFHFTNLCSCCKHTLTMATTLPHFVNTGVFIRHWSRCMLNYPCNFSIDEQLLSNLSIDYIEV